MLCLLAVFKEVMLAAMHSGAPSRHCQCMSARITFIVQALVPPCLPLRSSQYVCMPQTPALSTLCQSEAGYQWLCFCSVMSQGTADVSQPHPLAWAENTVLSCCSKAELRDILEGLSVLPCCSEAMF